jgi:hypothetical protein
MQGRSYIFPVADGAPEQVRDAHLAPPLGRPLASVPCSSWPPAPVDDVVVGGAADLDVVVVPVALREAQGAEHVALATAVRVAVRLAMRCAKNRADTMAYRSPCGSIFLLGLGVRSPALTALTRAVRRALKRVGAARGLAGDGEGGRGTRWPSRRARARHHIVVGHKVADALQADGLPTEELEVVGPSARHRLPAQVERGRRMPLWLSTYTKPGSKTSQGVK